MGNQAKQAEGSSWIWIPRHGGEQQKEEEARFVYFRRVCRLAQIPEKCVVRISADSRYKLYVNGRFVEAGPSKGNDKVWYYDELDIAEYLAEGRNVIAVIVLRYPPEHGRGNYSVFRTGTPGLYFEMRGDKQDSLKRENTGCTGWKCKTAENLRIVPENPYFAPLMIYERAEGERDYFGWMLPDYDDTGWERTKEYPAGQLSEVLRREALVKRTIPFLKRRQRKFAGVSRLVDSPVITGRDWNRFLGGEHSLEIAPHTVVCVELDAGELATGYLKLAMAGGRGAGFSILQSECYAGGIKPHRDPYKSQPVKGNRTDAENGKLYGYTDFYRAAGCGSKKEPEIYEPFWFRTFRFIRLTIETAEEPLTFLRMDYEETGYPLEIRFHAEVSEAAMKPIWDICERSLRRCMHETYEDCPFYEQLQYAMDARLQMLYTYASSGDDRLAVKCMDDFLNGRREDGLPGCCYPRDELHVIPGFAVYYIGMLYDHMMYFGRRELLAKHMEAMDGVLGFFERNLDERGLVGKVGDVNCPGNDWSFIDWTPEWDETDGVPPCTAQGPLTMESLLYLLGLGYAADIADYMEKPALAEDYRRRAERVKGAVNRYCVGAEGMYQDGPGVGAYSQHCQVFAVLTGTVPREQGRELLLETLEHKERYAQCSVAMMYYLFRALEKCDLYEYTDELWDIWRKMLDGHMTTCAEDSLMSRSDCHGWGALALYELPAAALGVRPAKPGCGRIAVRPLAGRMQWAEGEAVTPKGMVQVEWKRLPGGQMELHVRGPEGVEMEVAGEGTGI